MPAYPKVTGPDTSSEPALAALVTSLRERHNDAIGAVLVYGSCLRSGDIYDGLLDLYLLCDSYRAAYGAGLLAAANWLLPPNVFYAQQGQWKLALPHARVLVALAPGAPEPQQLLQNIERQLAAERSDR